MKRQKFDALRAKTNNVALIWHNVHGFADKDAALKMDKAMLTWLCELTDALKIWIDKGLTMSTGELILARTNLGAVVESWLKFFYCVYYNDYIKKPIFNKHTQRIKQPEEASFQELKEFSTEILWDSKESIEYAWIDSVQYKRNAIHSFKYRDIGTVNDFLNDIESLCEFVDIILSRLPLIEDYIEHFPNGYDFDVVL